MKKENLLKVEKSLTILVIIFCSFSQMLPWGEIFVISGKLEFYGWGVHKIGVPLIGESAWAFYPSTFDLLAPSSYILIIFASLIFPMIIAVLILSILFYFKQTSRRISTSLILSLLSLIFFIIFIQSLSLSFRWSTGFYLMIITTAILFVQHAIYSVLKSDESKKKLYRAEKDQQFSGHHLILLPKRIKLLRKQLHWNDIKKITILSISLSIMILALTFIIGILYIPTIDLQNSSKIKIKAGLPIQWFIIERVDRSHPLIMRADFMSMFFDFLIYFVVMFVFICIGNSFSLRIE